MNSRRFYVIAVVLLTLLAFGLRVWQIDAVPPGGRDDELSNALAVAQKVRDGDWQFYYPDASGHEGLYHWLQAGSMVLFGRTFTGVRSISVLLGTLTIPLTYAVGSVLFNRKTGLLAAAVLTVSFWSLMYSRTGIRHVSVLVFTLPAFYFFWRGISQPQTADGEHAPAFRLFFAAGAFMGIGFYTYFASRGVPLIIGAFCVYLLLVAPHLMRRQWRSIVLMFLVAGALAIPLFITLNNQPEAVYRVEEIAKPLTAAREGDFSLIADHIWRTLGMFHATGDDEFLYNIPFRPIFAPILALIFWAGIVLALYQTLLTVVNRFRLPPFAFRPQSTAFAFLLIWWLAGISPAFISIPAGSLGHTILAQPATMIVLALPVSYGLDRLLQRRVSTSWRQGIIAALGVALVLSVAVRDLDDYFVAWPSLGNTRFLYRADINDVVGYVAAHPELTDFALSSLLAGPWDGLAFEVGLHSRGNAMVPTPRLYNPQRAVMLELGGEPALVFHGYPVVESVFGDVIGPPQATAGAYQLSRVAVQPQPSADLGCFVNGLCVVSADYNPETHTLDLIWRVAEALQLPDKPLISYPPPPGVYDGPRLAVYTHLRDDNGSVITGDDGLWVDPYTLQPGDRFMQRHLLVPPGNTEVDSLAFGLYDPLTGERIVTTEGEDALLLQP
ncbi:MAG: glycosyltransferase family 39 protein [Anaerolineae bacterium]|nr:glycosyltransferase family 39 protein [Anaerolineae bacterium]